VKTACSDGHDHSARVALRGCGALHYAKIPISHLKLSSGHRQEQANNTALNHIDKCKEFVVNGKFYMKNLPNCMPKQASSSTPRNLKVRPGFSVGGSLMNRVRQK
jgi:hypothetical protein